MNDIVRDLILGERDDRDVRRILTPEGVRLRFHLAELGDRIAAVLVDALILVLISAVTWFVGAAGGSYGLAIAFAANFLIWNGYFIWFEGRKQGYTPGKRKLGIRVIDRHGGPLTSEAVLARNLTRNLELLLPLSVLLAPESLIGGSELTGFLAGGWILIFLLMPLLNRDRLRVGDLIAGTLVVRAPKERLLSDISTGSMIDHPEGQRYAFTSAQLDIYGVYELQVLEQVLRANNRGRDDALKAVAEQIKNKIGWPEDAWDVHVPRFLRDFYAAQRAHLEQKMLLGERRERKRG